MLRRKSCPHIRKLLERVLKPIRALTQKLDWIRDWKAWCAPLGIKVVKGIQHRPKETVVPHFWRFTKRRDLPASLIAEGKVEHRGPEGQSGRPMDVTLETKE